MAVVSAVAAVAGVATQYVASQRQQEAQEKQMKAQQQQAELQNLRAAREQARGRYRAEAQILSTGALGGVMSSSGVAGGVSSVGSQMASNLSYMTDMATYKAKEFNAAMDYANASALAGTGQAIASAGAAFGKLGQHTGYRMFG